MNDNNREPTSWAKLKRHNGLPVPHVASWIKGTPRLDMPDGDLVLSTASERCCHLCGQSIGQDDWAVIVAPQELRFGVASEPPGHFECLQYATVICPYLSERAVNLIVSCRNVVVVGRPNFAITTDTVTVLGVVTHVAWVEKGGIVEWAVPDEVANYEEIASLAMDMLNEATGIKVTW